MERWRRYILSLSALPSHHIFGQGALFAFRGSLGCKTIGSRIQSHSAHLAFLGILPQPQKKQFKVRYPWNAADICCRRYALQLRHEKEIALQTIGWRQLEHQWNEWILCWAILKVEHLLRSVSMESSPGDVLTADTGKYVVPEKILFRALSSCHLSWCTKRWPQPRLTTSRRMQNDNNGRMSR